MSTLNQFEHFQWRTSSTNPDVFFKCFAKLVAPIKIAFDCGDVK